MNEEEAEMQAAAMLSSLINGDEGLKSQLESSSAYQNYEHCMVSIVDFLQKATRGPAQAAGVLATTLLAVLLESSMKEKDVDEMFLKVLSQYKFLRGKEKDA